MKIFSFLLTISCIFSMKIYSQDKNVEIDILRAPASPASNLLGIATTDIDKPTDISSFMVSVQSASSSFTTFPSNYAIDFSPYYLFSKGATDFTTNGLQEKDFKNIFKQTFIISLAIANPDSTNTSFNYKNTYGALGFKFSICRGNYDTITKNKLNKIIAIHNEINNLFKKKSNEFLKSNEYIDLNNKRINLFNGLNPDKLEDIQKIDAIRNSNEYKELEAKIVERQNSFAKEKTDAEVIILYDKVKIIAAEFQTQRVGFSWDVNGGVSGEFRKRNFDNSKLFNAGIWTNFGYTNEKGIAFLGLIRYLYNPDKILALDNNVNEFEDISTFDAGGRIAYSKSQSKFSCSIEGIYRSVLNGNQIDPSWKMIFNADYSLFKNKKLTFSFGRDFDGTISKDGNLIAALTLIAGFGNNKISQPKTQ